MFKRVMTGIVSLGAVLILVLGAVLILGLGGFVIYQNDKIKTKLQSSLNIGLQNTASAIQEEKGFVMQYQPFECSGLIYVECKSTNIAVLEGETKQMELSQISLKLESIGTNSLNFVIDSNLQVFADLIEKKYIDAFVPHRIKLSLDVSKQKEEILQIDTKFDLKANNLEYQGGVLERLLIPELKTMQFFTLLEQNEINSEQVQILNLDLALKGKDLKPILFDLLKQDDLKLDDKRYQQAITSTLGILYLISPSNLKPFTQELLNGLYPFVLGEKNDFIFKLKMKEGSNFIWDESQSADEILRGIAEHYDYEISNDATQR